VKNKLIVLAVLLWAFPSINFPLIAYSGNIRSTDLPAHKAKVIVTFEKDIQQQTVHKYGQVLHKLKIINGLLAVVDRDKIAILQQAEGVKSVAEDEPVFLVPPVPITASGEKHNRCRYF